MLEVARLEDLQEGVPLPIKANGRQIILVRWEQEVYAVRNICPHQSATFTSGRARPTVRSCPATEQGERAWDLEADPSEPVVRCPWHKWEFRLTDGLCATDSRFRIRAYPTRVEAGGVFVDTRAT